MINMLKSLGAKKFFLFLALLLISADVAILLNTPFLRQILGFLFLTLLPGILILQILKLNKIGFTEKVVLSVGVSISFLMLFGLLINNLSLALGYETPLATIPLLFSFNLAFIVLAIVGYKLNKNSVFSPPDLNLTTSEKAFLIVPILFPALSVFGMHIMNTTDNNIILMFMLFLIPIYVIFVCLFNQKFSKRLYPVVIFLISISLLLMLSLRSNHLLGCDTHLEYYFFQTTLDNLQWRVFTMGNVIDACLAISLLPAIYQSILNIAPEFLFKILYSLIYSISPLVVYILSKKYVGESYAFLTSCFFMFQHIFLATESNARTNTAILFFALAMMILFSDEIYPLKKRILFIVFMASCMVSHYSTTYIFFFIMLGSFLTIEALSKKYTFKKVMSLTIVLLFFSMIFFWYSQVTETAFTAGVGFIEKTLSNLNTFFVEESRGGATQAMLGQDIMQKSIPQKIEFVFTWLTFAFIGIGVITLVRRYKEMSFTELKFKKPEFLKNKFEVEYFVITLACAGLLVAIVMLPYLSVGYELSRLYAVGIIILSVFFVIGGITLSKQTFKKHFFFFKKRKPVLKEKNNSFFRGTFFSKKRFDEKNTLQNPVRKSVGRESGSEVRAYLIILLVLIPYFFCVTDVTFQMFDYPRAITLNSEGELCDILYVHDQDSCGAKWLNEYGEGNLRIYTDHHGMYNLISQGGININSINERSLFKNKEPPKELPSGYIYLRYTNTIQGKLRWSHGSYNTSEISNLLYKTNKIYDNDVVIYEKEK